MDQYERWLIRLAGSLLIVILLYSIFAKIITGQISNKNNEIQTYITDTNQEVQNVSNYTMLIQAKTQDYEKILTRLQENNERMSENIARKNSIPNLLNNIMFTIPKEVQLLSLRNTSGKHIQIQAQAERYQYLGYFVAKLKNDSILINVTSTSGTKQGEGVISITIEGDLPY